MALYRVSLFTGKVSRCLGRREKVLRRYLEEGELILTTSYDDIWDKWDGSTISKQVEAHRSARKRYLETLKKYLSVKVNPKVLEVGCGSSIDLHLLAEEREIEAYGVDISETALEIAAGVSEYFNKKIHLSQGDAENLEFRDEMFEMVFSQGLIEHFDDPLLVLKEQARVLKPGGILVVNVPQTYTVYTVYKHFMAKLGRWEWGEEKQFSAWLLEQMGKYLDLEMLEKCGYDYWRSPFEMVFSLRTLNNKIKKIPFIGRHLMNSSISRIWDETWSKLEDKWGWAFMKNLVMVFRKPE
ncbi:MAG: methyltransferase domain-containing protein [Candidatus Omnitrophica bacterium]|nr:methyltransferase domain-containing protein [Candidatus Omnitrophota bacterium]